MLLERSNPKNFWSEIIAAPDPEAVRAPRYVNWPSVCDTTRTNWLSPETERQPSSPLAETIVTNVGFHTSPPLSLSHSPPLIASPVTTSAERSTFAGYSFSHDAAPSAAPDNFYSTILCAPGASLPAASKPRANRKSDPKSPKKRGRPVIFDELKRAEFLGMVKSGCTIRYAARRVGVDPATVRHACRRDPLLADRVARAEQERDVLSVRRIQNAGEKSWRAAAWLLERAEPQEFSLRHKNRDPWTVRGQRRLKSFVTGIVHKVLIDCLETGKRQATSNRATELIDERLAEIVAEIAPHDEPDYDEREFEDAERQDDPLEDDAVDDDDEPDHDLLENDGFENEEAAVDSYRQLVRKLNRRRR